MNMILFVSFFEHNTAKIYIVKLNFILVLKSAVAKIRLIA